MRPPPRPLTRRLLVGVVTAGLVVSTAVTAQIALAGPEPATAAPEPTGFLTAAAPSRASTWST